MLFVQYEVVYEILSTQSSLQRSLLSRWWVASQTNGEVTGLRHAEATIG